jgi:hypothetical protein
VSLQQFGVVGGGLLHTQSEWCTSPGFTIREANAFSSEERVRAVSRLGPSSKSITRLLKRSRIIVRKPNATPRQS